MALPSIPHQKGHITRRNREIARLEAVWAARKKVREAHGALKNAMAQLETAQAELDSAVRRLK